eukprot:4069306-Pyramimonas_sp.AAC.1
MLAQLPEQAFECVADMFKRRLLNSRGERNDNVWGSHMIILLTKKGFFTSGSIADLRPITLLPVIYK